MRRFALFAFAVCASSTVLTACGDDSGGTPDMAKAGRCAAPVAPTCTDEQIQDLTLFKDASTRMIANTAEGSGWQSEIDATAGAGSGIEPKESFIYAKFTATGLSAVAVGDEAAFASSDWDIAIRRFVIRLNSGVSGPGCVDGARTAANTDFDTLAAEPANLEYRTEAYYTDSCTIIPDGSGLGSPGTALQSFWRYPGCVQMTGNVFVVRLADGRKVKLLVTRYYTAAAQQACDENDMLGAGMAGQGGRVAIRWAFLGG